MPMYEFNCGDCEKKFEELVFTQNDLADVSCPACASHNVHKRLSAFAVGAGASGGDYVPPSSCATGSCCSGGNCGF